MKKDFTKANATCVVVTIEAVFPLDEDYNTNVIEEAVDSLATLGYARILRRYPITESFDEAISILDAKETVE